MSCPKLGIVILNYLTYDLTLHCINKLQEMDYNNFFVVVVDNNSPNESHRVLSNYNKDIGYTFNIYYIKSKLNGGYSSGNNIGIKAAQEIGAQYVLVMNNDIELIDKEFISNAIHFMEENINVGAVGPGIVENNFLQLPAYIKRPNGFDYIGSNLFMPINILYRKLKTKIHQKDKNKIKVYSVAGSCLMIRVEHFAAINFYDENVFLYGEELILGEKMYQKNYEIYYFPKYKVNHKHSVTIGGIYKEIERTKMMAKSIEYYFINYRSDISRLIKELISKSFLFNTNIYLPIILFIKKITFKKKISSEA